MTLFHHKDVDGFVLLGISRGDTHECTRSLVINLLLVSLDKFSIYAPLRICAEVDKEASCAGSSK